MKTLFGTFLFLTLTFILVLERWQPEIQVHENQENLNLVYAERLIYRNSVPRAILVGSSLAGGMRYFSDDSELFVLAQHGGSAREGLEVLWNLNVYPEFLFVETNALTVVHRSEFADMLSNPVKMEVAGRFRAFRHEFRPMNLMLELARNAFGRGGTPPGIDDQGRGNASSDADDGSLALKVRLEELSTLYQTPVDPNIYEDNINAVESILLDIHRTGTIVVLIEFPVHPDLLATPYHRKRREVIADRLSVQFKLLDLSDLPDVTFSDGIHFNPDNSRQIVRTLLEFINESQE